MNDILPPDTKDITAQDNSGIPNSTNPTPISRGPEGMSILGSVETIAPSNAETSPSLNETSPISENLRPAESQPQLNSVTPANEPKSNTAVVVPNLATTEKKVEVVNKATGKEKLHSIEQPLNDLTTRADLEEEDFIKHVEEIHTLQ